MNIIAILFSQVAFALTMNPTPFPVFLKEGFSTILEFEESPTQVVLGDQNLFQVEKLEKSIVLKPLVNYATTNMFVYFKNKQTRLFIVTASDENEPTYYKKFESIIPNSPQLKPTIQKPVSYKRELRIKKKTFDIKRDYLTLDLVLGADSKNNVMPDWDNIRLKYKSKYIPPAKLWSQRREVQKDSQISARLVFAKPNLPASLKEVRLIVPLKGTTNSFNVSL